MWLEDYGELPGWAQYNHTVHMWIEEEDRREHQSEAMWERLERLLMVFEDGREQQAKEGRQSLSTEEARKAVLP